MSSSTPSSTSSTSTSSSSADKFEIKSTVKVFNGFLLRFSHFSNETKTTMTAAVYLPAPAYHSQQDSSLAVAAIYYLSGLTCNDENVCQKSGVFRILSELGLALIVCDTSPRGAGVQGESDSWDFGVGAGFYLDASEEPWKENYRMSSYLLKELPFILSSHFPCLDLKK
jgi:S-formylglutathione hydrolase